MTNAGTEAGQLLPMHRDEAEDPGSTEITKMLRMAIETKVPVETLEKLVALHERVTDRHAASEFAQAMADFQAECPPISKTSKAKITTKSGIQYSYQYAELAQIARTIGPHLHSRGLSYTWDSSIDKGAVHCTCTLRHTNGHKISASFSCPTDTATLMNEAQKHAAALSYARRQSLVQVLGLTTCDPDTDAGGGSETITEHQAADLTALLEEVQADRPRFLKYMKVARMEDIRAQDFASAVSALQAKRRQREGSR